jgi:hypothetical protein
VTTYTNSVKAVKDVLVKHGVIFVAKDGSFSEQSDNVFEDVLALVRAAEDRMRRHCYCMACAEELGVVHEEPKE